MSNFKTGKEIINEWQIKDFEFFEHVKAGLQPYDQFGRLLSPPDSSQKLQALKTIEKRLDDTGNDPKGLKFEALQELYKKNPSRAFGEAFYADKAQKELTRLLGEKERIEEEISGTDIYSWMNYELPESAQEARRLLDIILSVNYRIKDLEKIRKSPSFVVLPMPKKESTPAGAGDAEAFLQPREENIFHKNGAIWTILFNGKQTIMRDTKSIRYIAHLLNNPDKEIYCTTLYEMASGTMPNNKTDDYKVTEEQLAEQGMSFSNLAPDIPSQKDQEHFKEVITKLLNSREIAIELGKTEGIERADYELTSYAASLLEDYGIQVKIGELHNIKFKVWPQGSKEMEKIRKNVSNAITEKIEQFKKDLPELHSHLKAYLSTGKNCIYNPDASGKPWNVKL